MKAKLPFLETRFNLAKDNLPVGQAFKKIVFRKAKESNN